MLENFRFVVDGVLAGMAHPGRRRDIEDSLIELQSLGIGAIVSLEEYGLDEGILKRHGFEYLHIPVEDFTAPTFEQADQFVEFVRSQAGQAKAVAAHCYAGVGRTGTMLVSYLIAEGASAEDALARVKRVSGTDVETAGQKKFTQNYAAYRRERFG